MITRFSINKHKRIICTVLSAFLLVFSLTACGNIEIVIEDDSEAKCQSCGETIAKDASFCASCGASIVADASSSTSVTETSKTNSTTAVPTPSKTTTTTAAKTTAKPKTTVTTSTKQIPTPSSTTTTVTSTTTATTPKTTRTATQEEKDAIYEFAFNSVMSDYSEYEAIQSSYIASLKADIDDLTGQAGKLYANALKEKEILKEKFAANGLLNSGVYTSAVNAIDQQYKEDLKPIQDELKDLREELEQAESDYKQAADSLPELVESEYLALLDEFQNNTLA